MGEAVTLRNLDSEWQVLIVIIEASSRSGILPIRQGGQL